jgi:hypothetical protein
MASAKLFGSLLAKKFVYVSLRVCAFLQMSLATSAVRSLSVKRACVYTLVWHIDDSPTSLNPHAESAALFGPGVFGALFMNSDISGEPNVGADTVLHDAYMKALKPN